MNHEIFFENLELLADAPNGVQKLREMILLLAVQGKLVPQDSGDESAEVLLEKINLEKDKLLREKKIKKQKQLPLIEPEELPFNLPKSWKWMRLGEVVDYNGALKVSPNKIPDDSWLLELEDIEKNTSKIIKRVLFKVRKSKSTKTKFEKSDVLYGKLRPYLNKVALADEEGFCTTEIIPLHGYIGIFPKYLMYSLKRPDFLKYVNSKTYGINLPRLGTEDARTALFPLSPFEEQKRIVAKVDQLMTLCDELEARQQKKHEQRIRLNNAALDKLLTAPTPEEFAQHWQRICDNFDLLYDVPETVGQLRQAILQLAVQGRLVAQDEGDEAALNQLKIIREIKELNLKQGKLQKDKKYSPIMRNNPPWHIPQSWIWIRLQDFLELSRGGSPRPSGDPKYFGGDIPWITVNEITKDTEKYLTKTKSGLTEIGITKSRSIYPDDLLLTNSGATLGVPKISKIKGCINDGVARLNIFHKYVNKEYAYYFLFQQIETFRSVNQGMGQPNLNTSILAGWLFPFPPLEEQKRIVAKVDQLMALCDELEAGVVQAQTEGGELMEAVMHQLYRNSQS
jgi:type I restriction enzyme S subunit